jgi:CheY-like chemotaxis protein
MRQAFKEADLTHRFRWVSSGSEAIRYLRGVRVYADRRTYPLPTMIVVNLNPNSTDGIELIEWLRSQPRFDGMDVIINSSATDPGEMRRVRALGISDFVAPNHGFDGMVNALREKDALLACAA